MHGPHYPALLIHQLTWVMDDLGRRFPQFKIVCIWPVYWLITWGCPQDPHYKVHAASLARFNNLKPKKGIWAIMNFLRHEASLLTPVKPSPIAFCLPPTQLRGTSERSNSIQLTYMALIDVKDSNDWSKLEHWALWRFLNDFAAMKMASPQS